MSSHFSINDEAKMGDAFPSRNVLEWDAGSIIWDIPIAWDLWNQAGSDYSKRIPIVYNKDSTSVQAERFVSRNMAFGKSVTLTTLNEDRKE